MRRWAAGLVCAVLGRRQDGQAGRRANPHALTSLPPEMGPMSTTLTSEADTVFAALRDAFERAAAAGHVVMTITVSNACPVAA